ncbi:hypothetical protein SAMN04489796_101640 [Winogradskyella thalassocola]|uniref:Uncharacterized protein n=1 Tax=Winogradskyella thalassocola TaxID=262004 RepID=A0A1G7X948_9FLAO|nr:hypothetical protein SAMN04489796_101640 [Winogradskyella thalassocola]
MYNRSEVKKRKLKDKKLEIMYRERIHAGTVGLVFKNGNYTRVITEGKHWIKFSEQVLRCDL